METSDSGVQGRGTLQSVGLFPSHPPPGSEPRTECEHRFMFPTTSQLILGLHLRSPVTRLKKRRVCSRVLEKRIRPAERGNLCTALHFQEELGALTCCLVPNSFNML